MSSDGNQQTEPIAKGQTNARRGSVVEAKVAAEPLIFYRPETNELLVVPKADATAFLNEVRFMDLLAYDLQTAKQECLDAAQAQLDAVRKGGAPGRAMPQDSQVIEQANQRVAEANKKLAEKQKSTDDAFKGIKLDETGGKLYELIPIRQRKTPNENAKTELQSTHHTWGKKWTHVRSEKIENHWRGYQLNATEQKKFQSNEEKSIVDDKGKVDFKKLREQVNDLETSAKWKINSAEVSGVLFKEVNEAIHGSLEEWANGINAGNSWVKLEPEFQLARYFAGAGANASWDPKKGNVAVRGDARAEFDIAAGKISAASYLPGQAGHMIQMTGPKTGKVYEAGLIRLGIEVVVAGMAGASACAQLGLTIDYTDAVKGKSGIRGKPASKPISAGPVNVSKLKDGADISASADLFAGARASGELKGKIEWNSPEDKKFNELCSIGPSVSAQAGAGVSANFKITFVEGKFRFLASASVCVGLGAGGKLEFEVDFGKTAEFTKYLAHLLYAVDYESMEIIARIGFDAWKNFSLLAIQKGQKIEEAVEDAVKQFGDDVDQVLRNIVALLEQEEARVTLMDRVLNKPKELDFAPPETKGMLIYQLTRHSKLTDANPQNYDWNSLETLSMRKRAVIVVLQKARSKSEFRNIMQHMNADGSKDPRGWEANFTQVKEFLGFGFDPNNLDQQLQHIYDIDVAAVYDKLYDRPVRGYAFVDNNNPAYLARLDLGEHDGYAVAGGYDPGVLTPQFDSLGQGPTRLA